MLETFSWNDQRPISESARSFRRHQSSPKSWKFTHQLLILHLLQTFLLLRTNEDILKNHITTDFHSICFSYNGYLIFSFLQNIFPCSKEKRYFQMFETTHLTLFIAHFDHGNFVNVLRSCLNICKVMSKKHNRGILMWMSMLP